MSILSIVTNIRKLVNFMFTPKTEKIKKIAKGS